MNFTKSELQTAFLQLKQLFENADLNLIPMFKNGNKLSPKCKNGSGIHIKKENRGKFTTSAKRAGQSVQEHARSVLNNPNATPLLKKRANFARNSRRWSKKQLGGLINYFNNI